MRMQGKTTGGCVPMISRRAATAVLLSAALPLTAARAQEAAAPAATPPAAGATLWPTASWAEGTPESQCMDSAALARLVDFGAAQGMDSLLVTRHGTLVAEAFYAPYRAGLKHAVNSTTKGIVATLTGMAIQDGLIASRDAPVLDFFADRKVANVDASKKAMTLGHLLDMTSGMNWTEPLSDAVPETMLQLGRARDWQGFVLDRPMAQAPGAGFNYNSGNTHLLSAILAHKTGGSTLAYAQKRLFEPLGITDVRWRKDPQGIEVGGWGLYLHPRDMAKVGYLYLRKGQWNGRQLLPAAWAEQVFNPSVDMGFGNAPAFRYANGWWSIPSRRAYFTAGFNRQLIMVLPDIGVVAVVTGRRHYPFVALIDHITAAAGSAQPLPANSAAQEQLAARIRDAGVEKPNTLPLPTPPELAASISRRAWVLERNGMGIQRLVLDLTPASPRYEVTFDSGNRPDLPSKPIAGALGLDGLYRTAEQGPNMVIAIKGHWLDAQTFQLISRSVTDGDVTVVKLQFDADGKSVNVGIENNRGFRGQVRGRVAE